MSNETWQEKASNIQRRERVLKYPEIAELLTHPPLSMTHPELWSGYIPPAVWREKRNDSPVRAQLIAICNKVVEREKQGDRPVVAPDLITEAQLTKLHICLAEYGITEKADKLMYLTAATGRTVESSKDLTKEEASLIIDQLGKLIRVEQAKQEVQRANQNADPVDTGRADSASDGDYQPHDQPRPATRGAEEYDADGPFYDIPGEEDLPPY